MSLNATPSSDRVHIGIFGKRNAGKSSVINAVTGQNLAIVSDVKGTTTDPVSKAMELLPLGPVVMIDTPGLDDTGELGALRVRKSYQVLNKTDIGVLIVDGESGYGAEEEKLLSRFREKRIPHVVAVNKCDLLSEDEIKRIEEAVPEGTELIFVSALKGIRIYELKELIAKQVPTGDSSIRIVGDLVKPNDFVILVVPIDKAAPKGRLILPQQQTIRDLLEAGAASVVVRETELAATLKNLGTKPALVITDSQVFGRVSKETPEDILLTSFSILFARYKGNLKTLVRGVRMLDELCDGDKILISEGCTHHRQCDDIGTVKLPRWLRHYTGKDLQIETSSGREFPQDLSGYALVIHCGGCMLNARELKSRESRAVRDCVPFTNYGIAIAHMKGILERSIRDVLPD